MNRTRSAIDRMAAQAVPTLQQRHRADPAPERELARILAQPRLRVVPSATTQRRWLRPVLVGGAVLAAVLAVVLVAAPAVAPALRGDAPVSAAATPVLLTYSSTGTETDPEKLLQNLADRAAAQPPIPDRGRFDYIRTRGWYLDLVVAADGTTTGGVEPTEREDWLAADGTGRIAETRSGKISDTSADYGPGELYRSPPVLTDPAALERAVTAGLGKSPDTSVWFTALTDAWISQTVEPAGQAALLRVLATKGDMTVAGTVTDRAGRSGVAVTTRSDRSGLPTDHTLIFDPDTGALLSSEEVVLERGDLPVEAPATVSYTLWLQSGRVDALGDRP